MANVTFYRGTRANCTARAVIDGQVLYETDQGVNNKIYLDNVSTRVTIGGGAGTANPAFTGLVSVTDNTSPATTAEIRCTGEITSNSNGNAYTLSKVHNEITSVYSASSTYVLGSFCTYLGVLYKCTTAITVAEAWNASHWTADTVGSEITNINSSLSKVNYTPTIATNFAQLSGVRSWLYVENGEVHLHYNLFYSTVYASGSYAYPITIPSGCYPSSTIVTSCMFTVNGGSAGTEAPSSGYATIGTTGQIMVMPSVSGKDTATIDIVYPLG